MVGRSHKRAETGFATIQYVAATGFSLLLFVLVANGLVDLYARAAVRNALDEGTHAAIAIDAPEGACEERAAESLDGLLGGSVGERTRVTCSVSAVAVVARARVVLPSWLPFVPDWHLDLRAVAIRES